MCTLSHSDMSDSSQSCRLQPAKLLSPWNFPGKNTGVGCHFLLQGISPDPGIEPTFLHLLHWRVDSLPLVQPGKPPNLNMVTFKIIFSSIPQASHHPNFAIFITQPTKFSKLEMMDFFVTRFSSLFHRGTM